MMRDEDGKFISERQVRAEASSRRWAVKFINGWQWRLATVDDEDQEFLDRPEAVEFAYQTLLEGPVGLSFEVHWHDGDGYWEEHRS